MDENRKLREAFLDLGLSEEEADFAVAGRPGPLLELEPQVVSAEEAGKRYVREGTNMAVSDACEKSLKESFLKLGMGESAAEIAAKGR
jgi:hypothetical protein